MMHRYIRYIISVIIALVCGLHAVYAAPPIALTGTNKPATIQAPKGTEITINLNDYFTGFMDENVTSGYIISTQPSHGEIIGVTNTGGNMTQGSIIYRTGSGRNVLDTIKVYACQGYTAAPQIFAPVYMTGTDFPASANANEIPHCSSTTISIVLTETLVAKAPTATINVTAGQATQINLADYFTGIATDSPVISGFTIDTSSTSGNVTITDQSGGLTNGIITYVGPAGGQDDTIIVNACHGYNQPIVLRAPIYTGGTGSFPQWSGSPNGLTPDCAQVVLTIKQQALTSGKSFTAGKTPTTQTPTKTPTQTKTETKKTTPQPTKPSPQKTTTTTPSPAEQIREFVRTNKAQCYYSDETYDDLFFSDVIGNTRATQIERLRINCIWRGRIIQTELGQKAKINEPDLPITTAEVIKTLIKLGFIDQFNVASNDDGTKPQVQGYTDFGGDHWANEYIIYADTKGIMDIIERYNGSTTVLDIEGFMSAQEFAELLVLTYNQTNWLTAPATKTLTINDIDLTFVTNPEEITRAEVAFLIDTYFDTNLVVTFGQKTAALLSTIADILATKDTAAQYDIINKLIDLIPTLDNSDIYPFTKDQILMILKKVAASK